MTNWSSAINTEIRLIGGHILQLDRTDKVFFPGDGITKGELIQYYHRIADFMLPHLRGRPLTMHRFPDGIRGEGFYQKEISDYFPDWIKRATVKKVGGTTTYPVCDDAATLVYLANQACVTPHVWLSREDAPENPDLMVFDLDPSGDSFEPVRRTALSLRDLLLGLGACVFVKTTGSRGLHVVVPLDRSADFDEVRAFAEDVAKMLADKYPEQVTLEVRKQKRLGRVYLDTQRNSYAQTAVAPYAVRALSGAPVATPVDWEELEDTALSPQSYNIKNIFERLGKRKDPWAGLWQKTSSIAGMKRALSSAKLK